jgi:hypothetical protein
MSTLLDVAVVGGVTCFGAMALAALTDLVSEELRGWLDLAPKGVLWLAAAQLPAAERASIFGEEWLPELEYILRGKEARPVSRLVTGLRFAFGLAVAARRVSKQLRRSADAREPAQIDLSLPRSPVLVIHQDLIAGIPTVTGVQLREWFSRLESGPAFMRCNERTHWLCDEHGLSPGYASAIVHEYELQRRTRLNGD